MICEFSLTPHLFDAASHGEGADWLKRVEQLVRDFFPRTGHQPVCISDLYGGGWRTEAMNMANACDPSVRGDVKKLLARVIDLLVMRTEIGDWPSDEDGWAKEALASSDQSHEQCKINRVWTTSACRNRLSDTGLTSIDDCGSEECWNGVRISGEVEMSIAAQLAAVRPLLYHSTWIGYVSPYIQGTSFNDELDLALKMLAAARERNRPDGVYLLDVHTEMPTNVANVANNIKVRFPSSDGSFKVRCFFWPQLLDRYLLFGDTAYALGQGRPRVRWAVAPQHFARQSDDGSQKAPTHWSLMPRIACGRIYDRFYDPNLVPVIQMLV